MLTGIFYSYRSYAQVDPTEESVALNARELLEDLGMHARALKGAALSARRIDELEARMLDIEDDLSSSPVPRASLRATLTSALSAMLPSPLLGS